MKEIFRSLVNVLFPPLCAVCRHPFEKKPFCPLCWDFCIPLDPSQRCPHCFEESEGLCLRCVKKPFLPFAKAFVFERAPASLYLASHREDLMASFLICQFAKLSWQMPDLVVCSSDMKQIGYLFAKTIDRSLIPFPRDIEKFDPEKIEEDSIILMLDRGSPLEKQRKRMQALLGSFPKKGYLLSLFAHDTFNF